MENILTPFDPLNSEWDPAFPMDSGLNWGTYLPNKQNNE